MRTDRLLLLLVFLLSMGVTGPAWAQATAPAGVSSAEAHAALEQVMARGEFQEYRGESIGWLATAARAIRKAVRAIMRPINAFFDGIGKLVERWLPRYTPTGAEALARSTVWRYLLYVLVIGLALLLLGLLTARLIAARRLQAADDALDEIEHDPTLRKNREPTYWERSLQQAEMLWADGQQREALRTLQRACLVLLDARGVLRYDESRANGEVLRELRRQGRSEVQQALRPVVGAFDRSWYGLLEISSDEFVSVLRRCSDFRDVVVEQSHA